jgi:peptidoglycan/xylan/chitin deacetylase (PgdA/CDA1 family)/glycosyltransferase involved in cell wall biosynthesis
VDPHIFEVVVASDGSTDGTVQAVSNLAHSPQWSDRSLICVEQAWRGAAAARNTALRTARGDLVLFLDDDIITHPNLVAAHLAHHAGAESQSRVVLGQIIPETRPEALHRQIRRWWRDHYARLSARAPSYTAFFTGNVSLPRSSALAVGGLSEDLDYGEDVEFGYRLGLAGLSFVYAPEAIGWARNPKPAAGLLRDFFRSGRGSVLIYRKHPQTLPGLPLSAFGETNLRMRLARAALLSMARSRTAERAIDAAFSLWAGSRLNGKLSRSMFELARSYYFWRGVRAEVSSANEWARLTTPGVPVLMYHSISPRGTRGRERFRVRKDRFARQMKLLRLLKYHAQPLEYLADEWRNGRLPPPRSIAITFDDGYCDNLTEASPVLRKHGYPATLFFVTGLAGCEATWDSGIPRGSEPLLTWEEVAELAQKGFRVEPHGVNHVDLTAISSEAAHFELRESRRQLVVRLGQTPKFFAYPYGHSNEMIREQVMQVGYQAAFSAKPGLNTLRTDRFAYRRVEIEGTDSLVVFAVKVWAGDNPFRYLRQALRSHLPKQARRR